MFTAVLYSACTSVALLQLPAHDTVGQHPVAPSASGFWYILHLRAASFDVHSSSRHGQYIHTIQVSAELAILRWDP
jgi:hypothetical protein